MSNPKISLCIPVYNSEGTLLRCLNSVALQNFNDYEIVIINDGSEGKDNEGRSCEKIVKAFSKEHKNLKKHILYSVHRTNLGLLEARRTAVENAHGDFILILDSDDELLPEALTVLYETAINTGADIVHGGTEVFAPEEDSSSKGFQRIYDTATLLFEGELKDKEIFDGYLVKKNHSGFLWGKLYRRELYLQALSNIPFSNCVMCEDLLQYFFISHEAKKYVGIKTPVYRYNLGEGISSQRKILDMKTWEKYCSTANVFTTIFEQIKEFPPESALTPGQVRSIQLQSQYYLHNNILLLQKNVVPELKEEAHAMLCDYWGKDFVTAIEGESK